MHLGNLKYNPGSRKRKKRIGRGEGSGTGCTAGKGSKGYRARSGSKRRVWFEGGQMPLARRLPKRGFTNIFKEDFQIVNLDQLSKVQEKVIDPEVLKKYGLVKKISQPVKILGRGDVDRPLEITASAFSESARSKIESAGGKTIQI
jgi:large subunit ribosomal protein L15